MSLEDSIKENTAAIKELSLIMAGIKGTPAVDTGSTTEKPQKEVPKGKVKDETEGKQETKPAETATDQAGSTETETSDSAGAESADDATELDYAKDVVPAVTAVAKKLQREGAMKVLKEFGVESAKELDKSKWPALIKACKKAIEE